MFHYFLKKEICVPHTLQYKILNFGVVTVLELKDLQISICVTLSYPPIYLLTPRYYKYSKYLRAFESVTIIFEYAN